MAIERGELVEQLRRSGAAVVAAMRAVPEDCLDQAGYEQGWTVKQIMAHVALMEFAYRRLPDIARSAGRDRRPAGGATFDMDGYNARQIANRSGATRQELIAELLNGRAELVVLVGQLDDALLGTPVRSAGGRTGTLAEVLVETAVGHVRQHGSDFSAAAGVEPTPGNEAVAALQLADAELRLRLAGVSSATWRRSPAPGEWSAAAVLGHIVEFVPYWAEQIGLAAAEPQRRIGRSLDDPARLAGPVQGEARSPLEWLTVLERACAEGIRGLELLPRPAWEARITNTSRQSATVAAVVGALIVDHVWLHVDQLAAALAAAAVA